MSKELSSQWPGFSKLKAHERMELLFEKGFISSDTLRFLQEGGLQDTVLGEKFIENVIGYLQLPLGIMTNLRMDGRDLLVPMAVEETSIVAAASKTAKWVRENGHVSTETVGQNIIGQIQIPVVKNFENFKTLIEQKKSDLIANANFEVASGMVQRGGGVRDIEVRRLERPDGRIMGILHVMMDPVDAMGANIMNQVCEFLKGPVEILTGEKVGICILSNLVDSKLTRAKIVLENVDAELCEKIEEASLFAELDPYRATTNNKGVMNGIDPILIATGNDWRAVDAGMHAYCVRDGQYRSLTRWNREGNSLVGVLEAPIVVGIAGGVTQLHPMAKMALNLMQIEQASDLSRVCAAVGLLQNLGALRALTTIGIIEGHMKLHIKNLSLGAGAEESEMPFLQKKLEEILRLKKRISLSHAVEALKDLRSQSVS